MSAFSFNLIKAEILIAGQQTDDAGGVVSGGSDNGHPVSTLKVGLDHLVVLAVAQGQ